MGIMTARIDVRLLHGIVATQWVPKYRPQRLMIIDDSIASDPAKKAAMRMAKPADVALSIITRETAYANYQAGKYDGHTVFVVARSPQTILDLQELGQAVPELIVGATLAPDAGVPATQVSKRAYVRDDEASVYQKIAANGCAISVQYVPTDKAEPLSKYVSL